MEPKRAYKVFRYQNEVRWKAGRRGTASGSGKPDLEVSSPPEFKGEAGFWTPEDLFLASINTCVMLTFVAFAQSKGLEFLEYQSRAEGMLENVEGKYRFTEVSLHPRLRLKSTEDAERARKILDDAEANCLVSNSVTSTVKLFPDFRLA